MTACDLLIIGGGINGAGIARDAAGRGLSVVLCEQGDLGGATSSASSKLIHGGLRYLEFGALRLVAEALAERERLLAAAPHLVRPLEFLLPWRAGERPAWMLRTGLLAYDLLAGRSRLPRSRAQRLVGAPYQAGLAANLRKGFAFWDAWADDARLVIANLRAAATLGARVLPRTACLAAERGAQHWHCRLREAGTGREHTVSARAVVNAAGPWAESVARGLLGLDPGLELRLVKGSHIVVPRVHDGGHALILPTRDGRVVFVLPFESDFSLIGTTETPIDRLEAELTVEEEEIAYLSAAVNGYLARPVTPETIRWRFAGVRPLIDDGRAESRAVTRDYRLVRDPVDSLAPALSVFGGKLTTYRRLSEKAVNKLAPDFPRMGGPWTDAAPLPGGQIPDGDVALFLEGAGRDRPDIPRGHLAGMVRRHGSLIGAVLGEARSAADLGRHFGAGLYERELAWFREREWAQTADDVLWRRGKFGLHLDAAARSAVESWLRDRVAA